MVTEKEDENNKEYAESYGSGRSSDPISRAIATSPFGFASNPDSIAGKAYRDGVKDQEDHGYKSSDDCGDGSSDDSSSSLCFLTTACTMARGLPDNCLELTTLRAFRDKILLPTAKKEVKEYYHIAPLIVSSINSRPLDQAQQIWESVYQDVRKAVNLVRKGNFQEAFDSYKAMTLRLKEAHL